MNNTASTYAPGIESLSGFAYQIKVFIYLFASLNQGEQIEFETIEDIAIQNIATSDAQEDYCVKTLARSSSDTSVFQVKKTNVSGPKSRNILYNWLLALNTNRDIKKFTLYAEEGYSISDIAFTNGNIKEYDIIIGSDKSSSALVSKVKEIYKNDADGFQSDYNFITSHYEINRIPSIDSKVKEAFSTALHLDAPDIGSVYAEQRIAELYTRVGARIMDSVGRHQPFISKREELMQICDEICRNICPAQYAPDYSSFARIQSTNVGDEKMQASREYQQLLHCNLGTSSILNHLLWELYYNTIRNHYLLDAKQNQVESIEDIAFENHSNVVMELQEDNRDTPNRRLIKTKAQPISALPEEHSRWGAYISLTNDSATKQISWKDDEND